MGLQNRERAMFLGIKDGKISFKPSKDTVELYDQFSGKLTSIVKRETTINGEQALYYDFHLTDDGVSYVLSIQMTSSVARSIVLSVASVEKIKDVVLTFIPYQKDVAVNGEIKKFTNIVMKADGRKLDWVVGKDQIPAVEKVKVGSKIVRNDENLIAFIEQYVGIINARLQKQLDVETDESHDPLVEADEFEDLPPECDL